jgi:anti-anti-sigma regulatory factor
MSDDTKPLDLVVAPIASMAGHLAVTVTGQLTEKTADLLKEGVLPLLQSGRRIVIELSSVTALDEAATVMLGELEHTAHRAGTCLHLAASAGSRLADTVRDNSLMRRLLAVGASND